MTYLTISNAYSKRFEAMFLCTHPKELKIAGNSCKVHKKVHDDLLNRGKI